MIRHTDKLTWKYPRNSFIGWGCMRIPPTGDTANDFEKYYICVTICIREWYIKIMWCNNIYGKRIYFHHINRAFYRKKPNGDALSLFVCFIYLLFFHGDTYNVIWVKHLGSISLNESQSVKLDGISFGCHSISDNAIASECCTCHDEFD